MEEIIQAFLKFFAGLFVVGVVDILAYLMVVLYP
jgi:hypothetical protein